MRLEPPFGFLLCLGGAILGFFIFYHLTAFAQEEEGPKVVINELAWAGSSVSSSDEWVELKNTTDEEINIGGWMVLVDNPGTDYTISLPAEQVIPAQGFFLIAKYKETNPNSALNVPVDLDREGKAFAISNDGFVIVLKDATGEAMDTAWDGSKPPAGGYGYRNSAGSASIERKTPADPGSLKESWQEATGSINFDEIPDVSNLGTPKAENSVPPPPPPAPEISSISPIEAESDELFELEEINGQNFSIEPKPQIELARGSLLIPASEIGEVTTALIKGAKFDLTGAEAGVYDLLVRNPDGQEGRLPLALTIKEKEVFDNTNGIVVSEILPKPATGSDHEFIELHNTLSRPVNLKGWQIDDNEGGSTPFRIQEGLTLPAFGYLAFHKSETRIALNDSGDIARAIRPDGLESHRTESYENAKEGWAWALFGSEFKWTKEPTPSSANTLAVDEEKVELFLEADEIKTTSVILNWSVTGQERVAELSLWQQTSLSGTASKITTIPLGESNFKVADLSPNHPYYFKLKALLKDDTIKESSLIKITTLEETSESSGEISPRANFVINEILPRPEEGEEEFIEIINCEEEPADLKGYQLRDASGKTFIVGEEISTASLVEAGGVAIFYRGATKIYLNDQGPETLFLLAPDGGILSQVSYSENAPLGLSLARGFDGDYYWTTYPTPGEVNLIITQAMLGAQDTLEEPSSSPSESSPPATLPITGLPLSWLNLVFGFTLLWLVNKK